MLTFRQPYPNGRILALSSEMQIGTIHPDLSWALDVPGHKITGKGRTQLAAKSALAHAFADWCRRAGLERTA